MKNIFAFILALIVFIQCDQGKQAEDTITVFCAASLTPVLNEINKAWEKNHQTKVLINAASSGTLARQIEQGAQADLFLSANNDWTDYLSKAGIGHQPVIHIANNELVVVATKESEVNSMTLDDFFEKIVENSYKISIGDPSHVPLGKYTRQFMEKYGIFFNEAIPQFIQTKDARSALRLVELGEVDIGIVYYSDAKTSSNIKRIVNIPETSHDPITYSGLLLKTDNAKAREYINFMISETTSHIWEGFGFAKK